MSSTRSIIVICTILLLVMMLFAIRTNCETLKKQEETCCLPPSFYYKFSYMQTVPFNSSQRISGTFEYDFDAIGGKSRLDSYTIGPEGQINVATNWLFLNSSHGQLSYTHSQGSCSCVQIKKTHFDQICYPIGNAVENEKILVGGLIANRLVFLEDGGQTRTETTVFNKDGNCWILNRNVFSKLVVQSYNYYNMINKVYLERYRLPANCPPAEHCIPM